MSVLNQAQEQRPALQSTPAWTQREPAHYLLDTPILAVAPADTDYNPLPGRLAARREPPPES